MNQTLRHPAVEMREANRPGGQEKDNWSDPRLRQHPSGASGC